MTCQINACNFGEYCTFESHRVVRARKAYKCGECQEEIKQGEEYEVSGQLYDGEWTTFKTCSLCVEIRDKVFCSWVYGCMWESLAEENVFTISLADLSAPAVEKIEAFWKDLK